MVRSSCSENSGLKKGAWSPEEDRKLVAYIEKHGYGSWNSLPAKAGLQRCGKSCRLRWTNYLRPGIKRGNFSLQEEQTIIELHALLGNRWSAIASHLHRRTDNEVKNFWNSHLKKRLETMGIDPETHKPKSCAFGNPKDAANLSHTAQWETARLEAEARLVHESKKAAAAVDAAAPVRSCLDVLKASQGMPSDMFFGGYYDSFQSPTSTLNFFNNALANNQESSLIIPCNGEILNSNAWVNDLFMPANENVNGVSDLMVCNSDVYHHNKSLMGGGNWSRDGNVNVDQGQWNYWNSLLNR